MIYWIRFLSGSIVIDLVSKPAIFGRVVQLNCNLSTQQPCCHDFTRKWTVGTSSKLIVMNGISFNTSKYVESLDESNFVTTLLIKDFSENDVNTQYE